MVGEAVLHRLPGVQVQVPLDVLGDAVPVAAGVAGEQLHQEGAHPQQLLRLDGEVAGKPLVALVSAADLERLEAAASQAAAGEPAEAEEIISTVSRLGNGGTGAGWSEPERYGLTAEHRDPGTG